MNYEECSPTCQAVIDAARGMSLEEIQEAVAASLVFDQLVDPATVAQEIAAAAVD